VHAKQKVLLLIYGEGGHRTEMVRLVKQMTSSSSSLLYVSLGSSPLKSGEVAHYFAPSTRHKYSWIKTFFLLPGIIVTFLNLLRILYKYEVTGAISTGPGLCVTPMLIMKLIGIKTLYIESFCRIYSRSISGIIMSRIADRFLVQSEELLSLYPKAEYSGRL